MRSLFRGIRVLVTLSPLVLGFLGDRKRWIIVGAPARRSERHHQKRAEKMVARMAALGPTFIKLGQLMSARADIFPEPYLTAIGTLQDQAPPDPTDQIIAVVEQELGRPVDDVFDAFEREPTAAASLGQVHGAVVNGRQVVVKVLRPGVEEVVALDLDIGFTLLFWLNVLFPNHHVQALTNVVREFSHRVREEMDFHREAENIERFQRYFREDRTVRAPEVLDEFTCRRVLVMERCGGTKIDQLHDKIEAGRIDFNAVMEHLTALYLRMMMVDGFLHADPHPGNLLVEDDGTIVVLDWGMVLEVPSWTRQHILDLALTVERDDLDGMINGMYRLGMISPEVSRGEIREAATEILAVMARVRLSNRDRVDEIVQEILDTFYTWPLMLPQELVYLFRTSVLLEGIGVRYDEKFDGLGLLKRVIRDLKGEILKTSVRQPVSMAKDLLGEAQTAIRTMVELLARAEREELRVRVHPRDVQGQERFLNLQARRISLSIFATATAVISSIIFISIRNVWLLGGGLLVALLMFVLVFFIPTHLLESPLRQARRVRPGERGR
jgi:predicted unusual protein kinase regulating ubiquinone biosynthesis (AarF/ABC1/UbiB family)